MSHSHLAASRAHLTATLALAAALLLPGLASAAPRTVGTGLTAWKRAVKEGSYASTSFRSLTQLKLNRSAARSVKATLKGNSFHGPTARTILTLPSLGKKSPDSFAIHTFAPGYDTGGSDFFAQQVTQVFSRATGKLLGQHRLAWDGNGTIDDSWTRP